MIFRIYHETLGGHVHMRVFAGKSEGALTRTTPIQIRNRPPDEERATKGTPHV